MELTFTFFIKFALGVAVILALFFMSLRLVKFIFKSDFYLSADFSQHFYSYVSFLFSKSDRWLC
jgi:hypothetical protein